MSVGFADQQPNDHHISQNHSSLVSPGYQSIIQSARREVKGLNNFEIGADSGAHDHSNPSGYISKSALSGFISPANQRKNSHSFLYGKAQ